MKESARLIILDEPTAGLDPATRRDLWATLKQIVKDEGKGILFTTHYLEEADLMADRKVWEMGKTWLRWEGTIYVVCRGVTATNQMLSVGHRI